MFCYLTINVNSAEIFELDMEAKIKNKKCLLV